MLSPRWRKVLRDLWGAKFRTLLVVLSIAVGVFAVGAVTHTFTIVSQELAVTYPKANPAAATIYTDPFDADLVEMVRRMPGVAEAEARSQFSGEIRINAKEKKPFLIFAIPDFADIRINKVEPQGAYDAAPDFQAERGTWPPDDREIVLERSSLLIPGLVPANLTVGDTIEVEIDGRQVRHLRVAGLAHEATFVPAPFVSAAYGYVNMDTYEWLTGSRRSTTLNITVSENKTRQEHIKQVAESVKRKIESGGRTVYIVQVPEPNKHPLQDIFAGLLLLLNLLGFGSLFLSGFLVVNTISALLAQQVRQIGMMKAIGARTRQMVGMYLAMVMLFGVMALLIAIPLAALVASQASLYLAGFVNVDFPDFSIPPGLIILEIMIGLGLPLVVAIFPILSGTRVTVRQAITDYGISDAKAGTVSWSKRLPAIGGIQSALAHLLSAMMSRPMILSFRNTFRRKGRLILTLLTLILAGTIFISVTSVSASMALTLDEAFKYWQFDILLPLAHPYRTDLLEPTARQVPGVVTVESWGYDSVRRLRADDSESDLITLFAPPPGTQMLFPTVVEGRWLLPEDENAIVLSLDVARAEKDVTVGDEITLKMQDRKITWRVVGKVRTVGRFGAGIGTAYVNYPYYAHSVGMIGRAGSVQIVTDKHAGAYQKSVQEKVEAEYKAVGVRTVGGITSSYIRESNELFFNIITALLMIMAILMAAVGGLGLMGTMSLNVLERTREIGVMRAIGASNDTIRNIVIAEGVFIGLLSAVIAAVLAYPLSQGLCALVGEAIFQLPLNYAFSVSGMVLWMIIVVILSAASSFLPAFNASRLTVREVLAYE